MSVPTPVIVPIRPLEAVLPIEPATDSRAEHKEFVVCPAVAHSDDIARRFGWGERLTVGTLRLSDVLVVCVSLGPDPFAYFVLIKGTVPSAKKFRMLAYLKIRWIDSGTVPVSSCVTAGLVQHQ